MPGSADNVLGIHEAARYVGLSTAGLKAHLYKIRDLAPDRLIGKTVVFSKQTLDDFQQRRRPAHRPRRDRAP